MRLSNPMLAWEMTSISRKKRYYWLRCAYASLLLFMLWSVFASNANINTYSSAQFQRFAEAFFWTFTYIQLTAVLILTPTYVATGIAIEKQRRTIEYLFTSDLTNFEIVSAKWVARTSNLLLLILSAMPVVSCAMLFGAIDPVRLLLVSIISILFLLSCASISIFVSVYSEEPREALVKAYVLIAFVMGFPLFLMFLQQNLLQYAPGIALWSGTVVGWISVSNPFIFVSTALVQSGLGFVSLGPTAAMSVVHLGVTFLLLGISILRVRQAQLNTKVVKQKERKQRKRREIGALPVFWKEWWLTPKQRGAGLMRGLGVILWVMFYLFLAFIVFDRMRVDEPDTVLAVYSAGGLVCLLLVFLVGSIAKRYAKSGSILDRLLKLSVFVRYGGVILLWTFAVVCSLVQPSSTSRYISELSIYLRIYGTCFLMMALLGVAVRASGSVGSERDRDTWLTLLSTSLTGREIVLGKLTGSLKPLFCVVIFLLPAWGIATFQGALTPIAVPLLLIELASYGFFLASVGTYLSLARSSTTNAIILTVVVFLLINGGAHLVAGCVFGVMAAAGADAEIVFKMLAASLPWLVVGASMMSYRDWNSLSSADADMMFFFAFFVFAYAVVGLALSALAVNRFAEYTGRTSEDSVLQPVKTSQ